MLLPGIHLLCRYLVIDSQWLPKTLFCLAVQMRQEIFWLWNKTKSCKSQCWKGWLTFRSVPSTLWDWRGCSESHSAQKPSHVMSSTVSVGLKSLWCRTGVFSVTFGESYPTKLAFCTCWSLRSRSVWQQANSLFPNGRVRTLHPIFHTFRHLSISWFTTQCFKKVPGCVKACWPLCKAWGAFAVTWLQDPWG